MTSNQKTFDTSTVNKSLQKTAKGTLLVVIGTLIGSLLLFFSTVLIIRKFSQEEYGLLSLAIAFLTLLYTIGTLGLGKGIVRNIAYYVEKNDTKKVTDIISSSIVLRLFLGVIICVVIFIISDFLAITVFNEPLIVTPLRIIACTIPFFLLTDTILTIFRGFNNIRATVYFDHILFYLIYTGLILIIIFFEMPFIYVFYAYLGSTIGSLSILFIYTVFKLPVKKKLRVKSVSSITSKELIIFSLPLWLTSLIAFITGRVDTFLIVGYKGLTDLGLYNAVRSLSGAINLLIGAVVLVNVPILSGLYSKGKFNEIKRNYAVLTKWLIFVTLPIFLVFFIFSEELIIFLFEEKYLPAATVFRVFCISAIIYTMLGLNNHSLIAIGRTRWVLIADGISAVFIIALNVYLIPIYGIEGAAIAAIAGVVIGNTIRSWKLYDYIGAQPFSKNLVKPLLITIPLILITYFTVKYFIDFDIIAIFLLYLFCYVVLYFSIIVTKSLDHEDLELIKKVKEKLGIF